MLLSISRSFGTDYPLRLEAVAVPRTKRLLHSPCRKMCAIFNVDCQIWGKATREEEPSQPLTILSLPDYQVVPLQRGLNHTAPWSSPPYYAVQRVLVTFTLPTWWLFAQLHFGWGCFGTVFFSRALTARMWSSVRRHTEAAVCLGSWSPQPSQPPSIVLAHLVVTKLEA